MDFETMFNNRKPVIGCIHLKPLPGSPLYDGNMSAVYDQAALDADIYVQNGVNGLIIENFGDRPFYPENLPAETVAAIAAVSREIRNLTEIPIGINALRNDAVAAIAVATAVEAQFIRVNVHLGVKITDQGILEGKGFQTLRLRHQIQSDVLVFADIRVKHASSAGGQTLADETMELTDRGLVDAMIVTGKQTGLEADINELKTVKQHTSLPVLAGSGITLDNVIAYHDLVEGFIIGSYFKVDGIVKNPVDEDRVRQFMQKINSL